MELIDVNALWDVLFPEDACGGIYGWGELGEIINDQPTVVDLVFCKECEHLKEYSAEAYKLIIEGAIGYCFIKHKYSNDLQFISCGENDFCSYGEPINHEANKIMQDFIDGKLG